ncbi:MAG TPA: hypothetical protein VMX14_09590 [Anaerolineae bacterium]|nr:hypothetical protein [Anaerolineae bacterium]
MEYGRIVRRALDITWRHKVLWVFGIAAALFGGGRSGGGGGGGSGGGGVQSVIGSGDFERWWPQTPPPNWETIIPILVGIGVIALVVGFLVLVVSIIVRYTSLGALAGMVDEVERTEGTSFKSGVKRGWACLLRLFAIDLLIGIVVFVIVMALLVLGIIGVLLASAPAALLFQAGTGAGVAGILWAVAVGLVLLLAFILVGLALSAVVTLIREFAFRACILDGKGVFGALGEGIALTRNRSREAVLMWLIMVAINLALGLVSIPFALLGVGAMLGPALLAFSATRSPLAAAGVALPFLFVIALASAAIGGIYLTFRSAVWTLTYRELRAEQVMVPAT